MWARITGKPRSVSVQGTAAFDSSLTQDVASVVVGRRHIDRDTIAVRTWLADLDDRLTSVFELLAASEKRRSEDRDEFARRLGGQRDELWAEIVRETRNGWQLVVWGLGYTFIGVMLAAFV